MGVEARGGKSTGKLMRGNEPSYNINLIQLSNPTYSFASPHHDASTTFVAHCNQWGCALYEEGEKFIGYLLSMCCVLLISQLMLTFYVCERFLDP